MEVLLAINSLSFPLADPAIRQITVRENLDEVPATIQNTNKMRSPFPNLCKNQPGPLMVYISYGNTHIPNTQMKSGTYLCATAHFETFKVSDR